MHRAHEVDAAPAIGQLIRHHLGDRQLGHRRFERTLQAVGQRGAGRDAVVEQRFVLAVGGAAQIGHCGVIRTERGQALQQRGRGLAIGVEADAHRHQLGRHRLVGGTCQHGFDMHAQTARRGEMRHGCLRIGQTLRNQTFGERGGKGLAQLLQRLGWQFFDEEFDEQIAALIRSALMRPPSSPGSPALHPPILAAPSGSPAARGCRDSSSPPPAPDCGCGRCRRRARSPKSRRARRAG